MENPIGKVERERLSGAIRRIKDAVGLIQAAKSCGINCDEREQVLAGLWQQIEAIQKNFLGTSPGPLTGNSIDTMHSKPA